MKLRNIIFFQILFIFIFFGFAKADDYFDLNLTNDYSFSDDGNAQVVESVAVKNKTTEKYLPSFEYKINNVSIKDISVTQDNTEIPSSVTTDENSTTIKVNFSDKVLGKDKIRNFQIKYSVSNIAEKTGDVWELSIPKIENIQNYFDVTTTISVPKDFGNEAYFSPNYVRKTINSDRYVYDFDKNAVSESRIVAAFGEYQVFDYSINYHLKNSSGVKKTQTIALPSDTSYQRVFFKNLEPRPDNIIVDDDGNWIAQYELSANSQKDVVVNGFVQIFSYPRKYLTPGVMNLYDNIKETKYWQVSDPKVVELAKKLQTPENIYNFVVNNLNYDYSLNSKDRLGAVNTITTNESVTCREFTDLTIALLRASGIPAREVIGYTLSDNQSVKSISFFNDVLHSWVEYWDNDKKLWVSIDPTWGATSKSDYFNKFDLRHFAFTTHGKDDTLPYPPGSFSNNLPSKDISVSVGNIENIPEKPLKVESNIDKLYVFSRNMKVTLTNNNPFALYDKNIKYLADGQLYAEDNMQIIPPFSKITRSVYSKYSFLGQNTPSKYTVEINGSVKTFPGSKLIDTYSQLILVSLLITAIISTLLIRQKLSQKSLV